MTSNLPPADAPKDFGEFVHREIHRRLHLSLDELAADYLRHNPESSLSGTSILDLMSWSSKQVEKPSIIET